MDLEKAGRFLTGLALLIFALTAFETFAVPSMKPPMRMRVLHMHPHEGGEGERGEEEKNGEEKSE